MNALSENGYKPVQERNILIVLSVMQFSHILDFVIMMPLGPQLMRTLSISTAQFGLLVSSYTFSAAVSGLLSAFYTDRFDRKTSLLFIFSGFIIGTLLCALSFNYEFLLFARIVAGAFGGLLNAMILAIIGDVFPENRRGKATGIIMSSFSIASILGVPVGLFLASSVDWELPFAVIVMICLILFPLAVRFIPSIKSHISADKAHRMLDIFRGLIQHPESFLLLLFMFSLMMSVFTLIPFLSPFLVQNAGLPEKNLWMVYFAGGSFTFFTARFFGRLSDRYGKKRVFITLALLANIPILLLAHLYHRPIYEIIAITTLFMILLSGRSVPALALISGSVPSSIRGGFMGLNSSVQQLSSGIAAVTAGMIIYTGKDGKLMNYDLISYLSVFFSFLSVMILLKFKYKSR